jgi:hypothetical protein
VNPPQGLMPSSSAGHSSQLLKGCATRKTRASDAKAKAPLLAGLRTF